MNGCKSNIIILGCQRSGKTMLTNMLCSSDQYSPFSVDSLIYAFEKNIPSSGIDTETQILDKSKKLTDFISDYFCGFSRSYKGQRYILEGCQLLPKDVMENIILNKNKIVCLGYPEANIDEIYNSIRENDSRKYSNAYTTGKSEKELKGLIDSWIKFSKLLKVQCKKLNIPFFETNKNREMVLESIVDFLNK